MANAPFTASQLGLLPVSGVQLMRFLLRLAFWLGVVAILLPSGSQPPPGGTVSATEAVSAAEATVGDLRQFCGRQPAACSVGSQAAVALGARAKAGARQVYNFINDNLGHEHNITAAAGPVSTATAVPL